MFIGHIFAHGHDNLHVYIDIDTDIDIEENIIRTVCINILFDIHLEFVRV